MIASLVLDYLEGVFGSREHLIALSASYRSCQLAELNPAAVFEDVAISLPSEAAKTLRAFLHRPESLRRPEEFGLVEQSNQDGEIELELQM